MWNRKWLPFCVVLTLLMSIGCGKGGDAGKREPEAKPSAQAESGAQPGAAGTGAGFGTSTVSGKVTFEGAAPAATPIKMDADPYCLTQHAGGHAAQKFVVGPGGGLKWVFVYVKEGVSGEYKPAAEPVVLDQKGCVYEPHVIGIMAGQELKILNSDATLHNIHSLAKNSREFNLAMPRAGMEIAQKFQKPEVMVRIKCDVHPWMESWAGVLNHPFHSVTSDDGSFSLKNLPAGTYTIEAWHEAAGTKTQTVTLGDGEAKQISFTFAKS